MLATRASDSLTAPYPLTGDVQLPRTGPSPASNSPHQRFPLGYMVIGVPGSRLTISVRSGASTPAKQGKCGLINWLPSKSASIVPPSPGASYSSVLAHAADHGSLHRHRINRTTSLHLRCKELAIMCSNRDLDPVISPESYQGYRPSPPECPLHDQVIDPNPAKSLPWSIGETSWHSPFHAAPWLACTVLRITQ